jgi:hypothetical protein
MKRKTHPNKEIEKAIVYAESKGWRYKKAGNSAHAWGRMLCTLRSREGCGMSICQHLEIPILMLNKFANMLIHVRMMRNSNYEKII